jgi:hypothetical protein
LSDPRRKLLENLARDGKSVEELGQSFRMDYDAIETHLAEHQQEPEDHGTRTSNILDEMKDMVEAARTLTEKEDDAANFSAYATLVKLYYTISNENDARLKAEAEAARKVEVLTDNVIEKVLNPVVMDVSKVVINEMARLREEMKKSGLYSDIGERQFDEAVRRIGSQVQSTISPYMDTLRTCITGQQEKKTTGRKKS